MDKYISKIIEIIVYILKVLLIMIVVFASVGLVYGMSKYDIHNHSALDSPLVPALLYAYIYTRFNIIVFILLLFHKFNKYEIISESILYTIIVCSKLIPYFTEKCVLSALLMTVIMAIYLLIKKHYLKHVNNKI